jgi:hypothetical protein
MRAQIVSLLCFNPPEDMGKGTDMQQRRIAISDWRAARRAGALALALAGAGCANVPASRHPEISAAVGRTAREAEMNQRWQNRNMSELVAALGEPILLMTIPGGGNPPGFAVVYGQHTGTGCIDAFAMLYGPDPRVRIYYCR